MKRPLLLLLACALGWLLLAALAGILADAKLLWPALADDQPWLTYGRLRPFSDTAMLFGWASPTALGVALWLLARLGHSSLRSPALFTSCILLWNIGVFVGEVGILLGHQNPFPSLVFCGPAALLLVLALLGFSVCGLFLLVDRTVSPFFVSQWYLIAALLCFPWLYLTANTLLVWYPVSGSVQIIVSAWYRGALFWLWLVPVGSAILYYAIPTAVGRPIYAYPSSVFAFRCLVGLGGWTGLSSLIGGPVSAWLVSASAAAGLLMLIPVVLILVNLFGTLRAAPHPHPPLLSFASFSLICLGLAGLQNALLPFTSGASTFTGYAAASETMRLFAFSGMALMLATYLIISSLGGELPPVRLRLHYLVCVSSITLMFLSEGLSHGGAGDAFLRFLHLLSSFGFLAFVLIFGANLVSALRGRRPTTP